MKLISLILFQASVALAVTMKRYVLLDEFGTTKARRERGRINKKILDMLSRVQSICDLGHVQKEEETKSSE